MHVRTSRPAPLPRSTGPQFLRYAGAGIIGTAVQYSILVALVQIFGTSAVLASTLGAVVGAFVNYRLNHRFTFASDKTHVQALPRFVLVALAGIALNAIVVGAMLAFVTSQYLIAQVAATVAVLIGGYLANRTWTF